MRDEGLTRLWAEFAFNVHPEWKRRVWAKERQVQIRVNLVNELFERGKMRPVRTLLARLSNPESRRGMVDDCLDAALSLLRV